MRGSQTGKWTCRDEPPLKMDLTSKASAVLPSQGEWFAERASDHQRFSICHVLYSARWAALQKNKDAQVVPQHTGHDSGRPQAD
jgi:hypothetical protein